MHFCGLKGKVGLSENLSYSFFSREMLHSYFIKAKPGFKDVQKGTLSSKSQVKFANNGIGQM